MGKVCFFRKPSSHSTLSKSKWFVGSSSSKTSGPVMKILERPMRTFHPPEKTPTGCSKSSLRNPTWPQILSKRSSRSQMRKFSACSCRVVRRWMRSETSCAESTSSPPSSCFSISSSLSWTSCNSCITAFSLGTAASSSSFNVFSGSNSSTKDCESVDILIFGELRRISPSSWLSSSVRMRNCVVFPQPLAPTSASLTPVFTVQEASCKMVRPPSLTAAPLRPMNTLPVSSPFSRTTSSSSSSPRRRVLLMGASSFSSSSSESLSSSSSARASTSSASASPSSASASPIAFWGTFTGAAMKASMRSSPAGAFLGGGGPSRVVNIS
mmetsp:Transcript_15550/g.32924  ORF Transcript_15550/g.32924 Transcript_15550/m.32924 type:complete len:325 (+) Transcript_15550:1335-2309(+)